MLYDPSGRPATAQQEDGRDALAGHGVLARDVQITRSFSFKLNLGNYESADFFCSQKADCHPVDADAVSQDLYEFCLDEVMKAVKDLKERRARKEAARENRRVA